MDTNSLSIKRRLVTDIAEYIKARYPDAASAWKTMDVDIGNSISVPKTGHGDISSSACFMLARHARSSPMALASAAAKELGANLANGDAVARISSENGYINVWLDESCYGESVISSVLEKKERYGTSAAGESKKVIVESPSVNPNKPWHIGHLRNALLGDSLSNLLTSNSYVVEREDYIDDLGLQMAKILWGLNGREPEKGKKYDQFLGEEYVRINREIEERKAEDEVAELLKRMEEQGSAEARRVREISELSVKAQYQTSFSYRIYHDVLVWESDIVRNGLLKRAMALLEEKGITKKPASGKYAGCVMVETEAKAAKEDEDNVKVFMRSNGTATYIAKDLAFHMWKLGMIEAGFKYSAFVQQPNGKTAYTTSESGTSMDFGGSDTALNVIGSEQNYPQAVLREVFKAITGSDSRIVHVSYGEVGVKGGTLSGREGGWLGEGRSYTADDLLSEMTAKTLEAVQKSEKIKDKADAEKTANRIALAAIKFEFLRIDPEKKVTFEWDKALDLNANSGPYCMYMYARASRILEKAAADHGKFSIAHEDYSRMERGHDFELVKLLGEAQEKTEKACRELRPNVITDYLLDISMRFSRFYEHMPVLKAEDSKALRIGIVAATRQVIYNMLSLLGIQTVESM